MLDKVQQLDKVRQLGEGDRVMLISSLHFNISHDKDKAYSCSRLNCPWVYCFKSKGEENNAESSVIELFFLKKGMSKMEEHTKEEKYKDLERG